MLELVDVSKSYRGIPAVRSLSLRAESGQVVGLLGPNGSGKSTSVRMIVGLLQASRGTIRWRGAPIRDDLLAYQSIVGYVPEEPRLYGYLTAIEYLELVGGLRDITHATLTQRIDRYLELFELDTNRHAPLASFSKGMRQKVLLSAALLHDPALIVLDEPNSGLDVTSALVLRSLIATLAARGKVVVYSSHVLDAVEKACDQVVILHDSHVVANDSVANLRAATLTSTLEEAFSAVAVTDDPHRKGVELADVSSL